MFVVMIIVGIPGEILSHFCFHEIPVAILEGQWNHFRCPDITVGRHSCWDLESICHEITVGILEEQWSHTCCHEMKVDNIGGYTFITVVIR